MTTNFKMERRENSREPKSYGWKASYQRHEKVNAIIKRLAEGMSIKILKEYPLNEEDIKAALICCKGFRGGNNTGEKD